MNKTALITGASGGIGYELAKVMAADGVDLVIISRNEDKLKIVQAEIEKAYKVKVYILELDLSTPDAAEQVKLFTDNNKIRIDYLINNAGFGLYGFFHETDWSREDEMIRLNIVALTQLCKIYIPAMIKNGGGRIMNIASTAAFVPGPLMAVYCATKAYVLYFSEAIANELGGKNISVTTLCRGQYTPVL